MTFKEAYDSGKNFRLKGTTKWCRRGAIPYTYEYIDVSFPALSAIRIEDAFRCDWEVEEVYYPVTEEELQRLHFLGGCVGLGPVMNPFDGTEAKAAIDRIKARGQVRG